ncbi:hypothetical protein HNP69_001718 [Chryseobacterium koreense]|nr:hypothetical protein [Chryseobacterium koreense]
MEFLWIHQIFQTSFTEIIFTGQAFAVFTRNSKLKDNVKLIPTTIKSSNQSIRRKRKKSALNQSAVADKTLPLKNRSSKKKLCVINKNHGLQLH